MDTPIIEQVAGNSVAASLVFVVLGAALVIFMQAGFAMLEMGFCRMRSAVHVLMTNVVVFGTGTIGFAAIGFALMSGGVSVPSLGVDQPVGHLLELGGIAGLGIVSAAPPLLGGAAGAGTFGLFVFQLGFMDAAATIPTGAMAERWKFTAFVWWGLFCGVLFFPVYGAWMWGGGWLSQLGLTLGLGHGAIDFAGSGVVHGMGGVAGLVGAIMLGPRAGKFPSDGSPVALPGHNIPLAILGSFILLFGWFGFNAASTLDATDLQFALVAANTVLAAACGLVSAMVRVWQRYGSPDPSMTANGMLAGLVSITASAPYVSPWAAVVIGAVAGVVVVEAVIVVERWLLVDDPVGAVAVHLVCGLFGLLALGLFANGSYGDGVNGVAGGVRGLLYGDPGQLIAQLFAAFALCAYGGGASYAFFRLQDRLMGLRSDPRDEEAGLDLPEIGAVAYPDMLVGVGDGGRDAPPLVSELGALQSSERGPIS